LKLISSANGFRIFPPGTGTSISVWFCHWWEHRWLCHGNDLYL